MKEAAYFDKSNTLYKSYKINDMDTSDNNNNKNYEVNNMISYIFRTLRGKSTVLQVHHGLSYDNFLRAILEKSAAIDRTEELKQASNKNNNSVGGNSIRRKMDSYQGRMVKRRVDDVGACCKLFDEHHIHAEAKEDENYLEQNNQNTMDIDKDNLTQIAYIVYNGKIIDRREYDSFIQTHAKTSASTDDNRSNYPLHISLHLRLRGGADRQNRVGSKFGGGGVSSAQQSERERKERLRQLALETVDLAKDPYLMRNHLGTYECKLCLTLHTNEG